MGFPECFGKVFVTLIPSLQLGWAVELRNNVCVNSHLPRSRHEALVSSMFQKGHAAMCEKYRQLLLAIGYKLVASFLLSRILDAGGETRIWNKQFGVRFGRGTVDSILIATGRISIVSYRWQTGTLGPGPKLSTMRTLICLVFALACFGTPE